MNNKLNTPNFFFGVIEDRNDPLKIGRVRVRCLDNHTEDKAEIPTNALPWATILLPTNSLGNDGLPSQDGAWVFGLFLDGNSAQKPMILGVVPGIPENVADNTKGFNDQRTTETLSSYPNKIESKVYNIDGSGVVITEGAANAYPNSAGLLKSDLSELSKNDSTSGTIVEEKIQNRVTGIKTASSSTTYDEPTIPYSAEYPFNRVSESESGHVIEIDDTPGNERLHKFHRTGTFEEIHPDGSKVVKIVGDDFEISLKNKKLYVMGNINISIQGDANILVEGDCVTEIDGNKSDHIKGNYTLLCDGNIDIDADNVYIN